MEIVFIDHYDSFSFNLIDWILCDEQKFSLVRLAFDEPDLLTRLRAEPRPLIVSPGPKSPKEASTSLSIVRENLGRVPILGVCLGHQILGEVLGYQTQRSQFPMHGDCKSLEVGSFQGIFSGYQGSRVDVAVYHSLVLNQTRKPLVEGTQSVAHCSNGEIMAIEWNMPGKAPAVGLQFHPESFMTLDSARLRLNWLASVKNCLEHDGSVCKPGKSVPWFENDQATPPKEFTNEHK